MKLYEPFNKTLGNKIKNFYRDNKETIKNTLYLTLLASALGLAITYSTMRNDKEVKKDMEVLESILKEEQFYPKSAIMQEEKETLEHRFNRIKNKHDH